MCEGWLLHHLTELLMGNEAGLRMLRIVTDHHGQVQLGEQPDADDDATPGAP
jgi:hypothetical protein